MQDGSGARMSFELDRNVAQERYFLDERDRSAEPPGRELQHVCNPYVGPTPPPDLRPENKARFAVAHYLGEPSVNGFFGLGELPIDHLLDRLGESTEEAITAPITEYAGGGLRWSDAVNVRPHADGNAEAVAVTLAQTYRPDGQSKEVSDRLGGGLRIIAHLRNESPPHITSSISTLKGDLYPETLSGDILLPLDIEAFEYLLATLFAGLIGVPGDWVKASVFDRYFVFRTDPGSDEFVVAANLLVAPQLAGPGSTPPAGAPRHEMMYRAFYSPRLEQIIYHQSLVTQMTDGEAFEVDPVSRAGRHLCNENSIRDSLAVHANAPNECLNALKGTVELDRLKPPAGGARERLNGHWVEIEQNNPLGFNPPELPVSGEFKFEVRSNDFAAVAAYYHFDRMFALVQSMGFALDEYFDPDQFPLKVIHRAPIEPTPCHDGRCINAQVMPDLEAESRRASRVKLALGDLSDTYNPLGVAADPRWLWHEFCHVLLLAGTDALEFDFCHSAGDALAAIVTDPGSVLADESVYDDAARGITFPFVFQPLRRHDREVEDGWGWLGAFYNPENYPNDLDPGGYAVEQILSSTLFRIYRAIGGDAISGGTPHQQLRSVAAFRAAYLIIRAIKSLGPAFAVPTARAGAFATALMEADVGTCRLHYDGFDYLGGALHKVIRWAFEQQGLFHPPTATWPYNRAGDPPPVDVYVDDERGRNGTYEFTERWMATDETFWVVPDGAAGPARPDPGGLNRVFVNVRNRGTQTATNIDVSVYSATGQLTRTWTAGWTKLSLQPGQPAIAQIPPGGTAQAGPFIWESPGDDNLALVCRISAPGDRDNLDPQTGLPCATANSVPIDHVVPYDNNLGHRSWGR